MRNGVNIKLNKMSEEKKYPKVTVGALIVNKNGKILLGKGLKWKGKYTIPGGHIEYGEKISDAIKREVAEETNIKNIKIAKLINTSESVFSDDFHKKKHLIFVDYVCEYEGDDDEIKQKEEFDGDFKWFSPEEALKLDLAIDIDNLIKKYIEYRDSENYLSNWKRCQADFENYKKDQEKRTEEFRKFANTDMAMQILPVIDNFEISLMHIPEKEKESPWVQGILHIKKQLEQVLKDNEVKEIEAKEGDEFNPVVHEAVKSDSNDANKHPNDSNVIKKVLQKGYKIDGKVIRAVRVIV